MLCVAERLLRMFDTMKTTVARKMKNIEATDLSKAKIGH